jgi:hypothetical protein
VNPPEQVPESNPEPPTESIAVDATSSHTARIARESDFEFLNHLYRKNTGALGFIPAEGVLTYVRERKVLIGHLNGQPAGYLLAQPNSLDRPGICLVHQACVEYDARNRQVGMQLVKTMRLRAGQAGSGIIQLWCRAELEANLFWLAAGFTPRLLRAGGKSRDIPLIGWRTRIIAGADLDAAPSDRRRSEAGAIVRLLSESIREEVIDACRHGSISKLSTLLKPPSLRL